MSSNNQLPRIDTPAQLAEESSMPITKMPSQANWIVPMPSPKYPGNGTENCVQGVVLKKEWNTKSLISRLATDAVSAASAAVMVAPLITIIDKAIMQNASGQAAIGKSLLTSLNSFVCSPASLIISKPFGLIFMLYGGTYLTANTLDTVTSTVTGKPSSHVTADVNKFAASSAANIGLCLIKDRKFAQLFGTGPPRPVGLPTMSLFALRDCMTIFASFNIPPLVGPHIQAYMDHRGFKAIGGQTTAQFLAPAAIQIISTPMHLLGLDLYNNGEKRPAMERAKTVWKNWGVSTAARVCRIVPAFGVGGVVNAKVRRTGMALWE